MLELILAVLIPFLPASVADQSPSGVEVVELFHAETPEDLEAALSDGYPMPWLEEILNDESIPDEDRYWLDCRMRAHIARYLHRFYDQGGNLVEIDAEWIAPGEHYWQEHLMVNPVGEDYGFCETPDYLPDFTGEPGTILNLYGEQTGELALTQRGILMSRDGSIGVLNTGQGDPFHPLAQDYLCLLFADGTFMEIETDLIRAWEDVTISQDGELALACMTDPLRNEANGRAVGYDRSGSEIFSTEIGGYPSARPVISADNRYIAIAIHSEPVYSLVIIDGSTGELIRRFEQNASSIDFPEDSRKIGLTAGNISELEITQDSESWECRIVLLGVPSSEDYYIGLCLSNMTGLFAYSGKVKMLEKSGFPFVFYSKVVYLNDIIYSCCASDLDISPNGCFGLAFNSRRAYPLNYEPSYITLLAISPKE